MVPANHFLVCKGRCVTYGEINQNANRIAHAFRAIGVQKGEKAAFLLRNSIEVVEVYFGLLKMGAVVVPLNYYLSPKVLKEQLCFSDAVVLIYHEAFHRVVKAIRDRATHIRHYICVEGRKEEETDHLYSEFLTTGSAEDLQVEINPEDPYAIFFTAGTTGTPKGVVAVHRNLSWGAVNALLTVGTHARVSATVSPMFHVASLGVVATTAVRAGKCVIFDKFEPREILRTIEQERISDLFLVPTMWVRLLEDPSIEEYDISSITSVSTAGSQATWELKKRILAKFPNAGLREVYGLTEIGALGTVLLPSDPPEKLASVGRPAYFNQVRIVDERGQDLPFGKEGEIIFRSPGIMREYYKDPQATSLALRDGWLYTGDLGYLDSDGYLYYLGRKDEMIISGGENLHPFIIERILNQHPKILESAVIGVPDPLWGESVKAVIVLRQGVNMTKEEVTNYCGEQLGGLYKPKHVEFVENLPRVATGKVAKQELRKRHMTRR